MTALAGCLLVSSMLFAVGLAGALTRRNTILVLVGIELMLNAANLNFVAFWRFGPHAGAVDRHDLCSFLDRRCGCGSGGWARTYPRGVPARENYRSEPAHREATVELPMASTVWIVRYLWLIPALPILAAGIGALLKQRQRRFAATIAITLHELFLCAGGGCLCPSPPATGATVLQFSVDAIRVRMGKAGLGAGPPGSGHAGDGHFRRVADFHLQRGVYAPRRKLHPVFLLSLPLCGRDARFADRQ